MKLMAKYLEGDTSVVPADKLMIVPTKVIDSSNVEEFRQEMQKLLSEDQRVKYSELRREDWQRGRSPGGRTRGDAQARNP
jgi:hypothetical protein